MRRAVFPIALAFVLALSAARVDAQSRPSLTGGAAGIELCPQSICGFALFVGQFEGEVNERPADGSFLATVEHGELPPLLMTTPITGGEVIIKAGRRLFVGSIAGGEILNLDDVQYCVSMAIDLSFGGRGQVFFTGLLDHGPFPPTITGVVTQSSIPCTALLPA